MTHSRWSAALLVFAQVAVAVAAATGSYQPRGLQFRLKHCNVAFFQSILPPGSKLERVDSLNEGSAYGEGAVDLAYPTVPTNLPGSCAAIIHVTSSSTSFYRVGIFLPDDWNERFLVVGNGGFGGGINWPDMASGAHYGFATVSTDTGHSSHVADLTWAYLAPQKRIDWGWRSIHGSVNHGKALTKAYYGASKIKYSYYSGCSTGGRQGLKEVQMSPESFDGALIGSAAWQTNHLNNYVTHVGMLDLPVTGPGYVSPNQFSLVANEVMRQCDAADGVEDGIVSAPHLCTFDLGKLQCGNGSALNQTTCLSSAQVGVIKEVYGDWRSETGELLYTGYTLSSEDQWSTVLGGTEPTPFGVGYQRYFLFNNPAWPWQSFNADTVAFAEKYDLSDATADKYDISAFRKRGGKVLMYHGLADGLVGAKASELYYNRTMNAMGGSIDDFFRLFLVPGMQHCLGTVCNAPWYFAGWSQATVIGTAGEWSVPGFKDAKHDALLALMEWTENSHAPDEIIATTWEETYNPASGVLQQRPLCPYPKMAEWDRNCDMKVATSWRCR